MPHSVYDERGELLYSTESDILAFAYALNRQRSGKLITMLLAGGAEVVFPPATPAGQRAETAIEYKMRTGAEAREIMEHDPKLLPWWKK